MLVMGAILSLYSMVTIDCDFGSDVNSLFNKMLFEYNIASKHWANFSQDFVLLIFNMSLSA